MGMKPQHFEEIIMGKLIDLSDIVTFQLDDKTITANIGWEADEKRDSWEPYQMLRKPYIRNGTDPTTTSSSIWSRYGRKIYIDSYSKKDFLAGKKSSPLPTGAVGGLFIATPERRKMRSRPTRTG